MYEEEINSKDTGNNAGDDIRSFFSYRLWIWFKLRNRSRHWCKHRY